MIGKILYTLRLNKECRKCNYRIECLNGKAWCWHGSDIREKYGGSIFNEILLKFRLDKQCRKCIARKDCLKGIVICDKIK